ncbi:hypothetical protein SAMN05444162_0680 [Paenibacillaceae bacterium GAS479]|nr:hypothetical protein SAMN05444162_0680 [Paenibacillaceae bacterium GAS479]
MKNKPRRSNSYRDSSKALVLVLFILLVIVVRTFSKTSNVLGKSSESGIGTQSLGTQRFVIVNSTDDFTLGLTRISGYFESTPPFEINPHGEIAVEVPTIALAITRCSVYYDVISQDSEVIGTFSVVMANRVGILGQSRFESLNINAPLSTTVEYVKLPDRGVEYPLMTISASN